MRVYERNPEIEYDYPEDMKRILDYLNEHGKILVGELAVERLYSDFSYEVYSASWMSVNSDMLVEFEDWLAHYNRRISW